MMRVTGVDPPLERFRIPARAGQGRHDRVVQYRRVQIAGHKGLEIFDPAPAHSDPLAMRPGQNQQAVTLRRGGETEMVSPADIIGRLQRLLADG